MKSNIVSVARLEEQGRWRVEIYLDDDAVNVLASRWEMASLESFCREISESSDPPDNEDDKFVYIGLENVETITGDLVGNIYHSSGEIRSRSKKFVEGDVLYGRLRPNLRKVLAVPEIQGGLCSTEFIVLRPNEGVSPVFLRAILASAAVSNQLAKLQTGAALPRVSSRDLMRTKIPLLAPRTQASLVRSLEILKKKRLAAKVIVARAPADFEHYIAKALND